MIDRRFQQPLMRTFLAASCLALLAGCGPQDEKTAAATESPPATTTAQAPSAPTGLAAVAGNAQVSLSWAASSGATSYVVRRSTTSGGTYTQVGTATSTAYLDQGVSNGNTYYYVVAAVNSTGTSAASSQVSASPVAPAAPVSLPAAPSGLVAIAGSSQVSLSWPASTGATSYDVKRSGNSGGQYVQIGTATSAYYTDSTVTNGTTYYYVVAARNSAGSSPDSTQASATPASNASNPSVAGEWTNITPPVPQPWAGGFIFGWTTIDGAKADAPKTLYVFVDHGQDQYSGVWKSTNGGDSWTYVNQGPNGELKAGGFLRVDPTNSNIVYAGIPKQSYGLFKTVNGGTSWTQILPSNYEHDVYGISIDPLNHLHLLLTFHSCQVDWPLVSGGVDGSACGVLESQDGGSTWTPRKAIGAWSGHSQFAYFLGQKNDGTPDTSGSFWMVSNQDNQGQWRTENSGTTWTKVADFDHTHGMQSLYRASNKALYMGSVGKIFRSLNNGRTWSDTGAQSTGDGYGGIGGDGTRVWALLANTGTAAFGPYRWQVLPETDSTSSAADPHWTFFGTASYSNGPDRIIYDPVNKILYSSQWGAGVFKLQVQ